MKTVDPTAVTITIAGRARNMRLFTWEGGSALVSVDDEKAARQGQKAKVIAYNSRGEVLRGQRVRAWTNVSYGREG
jgi:hypothetical protein